MQPARPSSFFILQYYNTETQRYRDLSFMLSSHNPIFSKRLKTLCLCISVFMFIIIINLNKFMKKINWKAIAKVLQFIATVITSVLGTIAVQSCS